MSDTRIPTTRRVAIVIFDEVEVLDFCGPFEVFAVTGRRQIETPFQIVTVAEEMKAITARGGLSINPSHDFAGCPQIDILLVPGGMGTRREMNNPTMIQFLKEVSVLISSKCRSDQFLNTVAITRVPSE